MNKDYISKFKGFKLVSLEVYKHNILGTNKFNFLDESDDPKSIYSTVIIGPNGTGKSEILKLLINIFRNLSLLKNSQKEKKLNFQFKLIFLDNHEYTFSNFIEFDDKVVTHINSKNEYTLRRYDELIDFAKSYDQLSEYAIPNIIASSFMLSDKFFIPITDDDKMYFKSYNYLGLKSNRQSGSTQGLYKRTVDYIVKNENPDIFKKSISKIANFLGLDAKGIEVSYKTKYTNKFWNGKLSPNALEDFFFDIGTLYEERKGQEPPFKLRNYRALRKNEDESLESLCDYLNQMSSSERLIDSDSNRSQYKNLTFNVVLENEHQLLAKEKSNIDNAIKLGLLEAPQINFISNSKIPLSEASSGEINLFATMIGIIATVKYGSLIIIDEPEVSLHPNWQMKYLHFLTELLSEHYHSHILIATHSHFLISDLQGASSNIIGLKKENNRIEVITMNERLDTFGWSAEQVLLDVFQVPTTRNYYIAERLGEILDEIAKNDKKNIKLIRANVNDLKMKNIDKLSSEDPLKEIVEKLIEKYG